MAIEEWVSGRPAKTIRLPADSHRPADDRLLQDIRAGLQSAFRDHRMVVLGSSSHVYAVVAYDAAFDMITLHNPYARGGSEGWSDGGKVARNDDGFFILSTVQLVNYYHYLCFELAGRTS